jgi:hypothetical protein
MDDVIIPKRFLGLTPGPNRPDAQLAVTLAVELEDGHTLRVAFPLYAILHYQQTSQEVAS